MGLWGLALVLDAGGPYLFGADGWKLVPGHFAERHGAIVIIALGESIVALGIGAKSVLSVGVVAAAVLGVVIGAALWWVYFDVTAIVAERRLEEAAEGRERNEIARDSYSYLHFPMVVGAAMYLLAHVAFRLRNMHTLSTRRLLCACVLLALLPVGTALPAIATLGILAALLTVLIAYEALRYAEARDHVRHRMTRDPVA